MLIKSERQKQTLIILGIVVIIASSNYIGYRLGVTVGQEADISIFGYSIKKNNDCLNSRDLKCLNAVNQVSTART